MRSLYFTILIDDITRISTILFSQEAPNAEKLLVGNACVFDPRRVISRERGQQLASSLGISMRETNTKCPDITSIDEVCMCVCVLTMYLY